MLLKRNLPILSYLPAYKVFPPPVRRRYLRAYKALFWSFFAGFRVFCASLRLKRTVFSWLLKKAILMALWTKAGLCVKACPELSRMGSLLEQSLPRTPSRPKTSVPSVAKNLFNQRNPRLNISSCSSCLRGEKIREISVNPWLINYLRAFGIFTTVERALQIHTFMQNEPNFRKSQMNVNKVLTKDYAKKTLGEHGKNEPKTNPNEPNQSQLKPIKCENKPNTKPIQSQSNPISEPKNPATRCGHRRVVLNLGNLDFEIVSDFDIRISDFNLQDTRCAGNQEKRERRIK